jgi:5-methylcytosine-specific restriction endonuclease McrA
MHRHCPHCNEVVPSTSYRRHLIDQHGGRNGTTGAWRRLRTAVLARDGARCTYAGCTATEHLEIHHLDWDPQNNDMANLAVRCQAHNPRGGDTHRTPGVGGARLF